jgi:Zinc finger, ZZ type
MYQRALQGYEKAWGPDHTSTLNTVYNLGLLYRERSYRHYIQQNRYKLRITWNSESRDTAREDLTRMIRLCLVFPTSRIIIFGIIGRMFIWAGQDTDAAIAFEQQIFHSSGINYHGNTICDGCANQLTLETKRFLCKACPDTDLCERCFHYQVLYYRRETVSI